jgi:fluoroquinolone transport system ATP-binding protein
MKVALSIDRIGYRSLPMIVVDNLSFSYESGQKRAIDGLSFAVEQGEIFGFLGPSGAGKSTTQKILIRLLRQYDGSVSVFDHNLKDWGPEYFERIGVSFEFPTHFLKLTAIENLTYFSRLYRGPTQPPGTLLEWVGLQGDDRLPVSQYSKGMKNRLSVARALLHNPELLFMDEPTAGLDPLNSRRIKNLIREQKAAGKTVLLTTHDMTLADELCDRVALIVEGRIQVIDRPRELKLCFGQPRVRVDYRSSVGVEHREFPLFRLGDNSEFLDLIRTHEVETIHSLEASLEDVFICITGRGLQ